jgi:hypothetical protein
MPMPTPTRTTFQTPPRILIPKLVTSRDGWKTKAQHRKKLLKAALIRNRDLQSSRDAWKTKTQVAEDRVAELQDRVAQLELERDCVTARSPHDPAFNGGPKKVATSN